MKLITDIYHCYKWRTWQVSRNWSLLFSVLRSSSSWSCLAWSLVVSTDEGFSNIALAISNTLKLQWFVLFVEFVITRDAAHGGDLTFATYQELEDSFAKQELHPGDLKTGVEVYINKLLEPIRKKFDAPDLKKLAESAYPSPKKQGKFNSLDSFWIFIFYNSRF